ncbi:MAG: hypothetical protein E7304_09650 [Butyrivibrio sp.]|jgi:TM2 domain-containing membrane protein YozV|uniref:hypothetical protein n=1 Tax=Butyrivibrio sp. TaxID=28121 RepID=UPI001EC10C4F|nr:hypothetical protein [Butyrivibrio sp.]MBE5841659.1 hypothetical protein [Butyrivibrio sp.]
MNKTYWKKGISGIFIILLIILIALLIVILAPIISRDANDELNAMDNSMVVAAEKQAKVLYLQDLKAFKLVFDSQNKKFIDPSVAKRTVTPYGNSKEHSGKYILVTVDAEGNISSKWVSPYD